ncbi:hypothetical protein Q5752_001929 [Cryptotrichosporon argae]
MATYANLGLYSHSPYLSYAGIAGGLFCLGIAANAVVFPSPALSALGLTSPPSLRSASSAVHPAAQSTGSDAAFVRDLAHLYAARDAALGVVILAASYYKDVRTLGWTMLAGAGVAAVDGWVNGRRVKGGEWKHWAIAPVGLGLGAALLGAFDKI